jgi:hypothetical protein
MNNLKFPRVILGMILALTFFPSSAAADDRISGKGIYRVRWQSLVPEVTTDLIHDWRLHVETADRRPAENLTITVSAHMPGHAHGLPTQPRATAYLGDGDYRIDGMKFQMSGIWWVRFDLWWKNRRDWVIFEVPVK